MKARTLISDVLQDIGYLGVGDYLSDEDAQYCLRLLNDWINALALEPLILLHVLRTSKTLTANTQSYTIGAGGDINITRPDRILDAGLIIDTAATSLVERPVDILTEQRWKEIPIKTLPSPYATSIYYDRNWVGGLGTIYPYPVPTIGTTALILYTEEPIAEFANLDTDYTFAPGYRYFIRTNLRGVIADGFGKSVTPMQDREASRAKAAVKRRNTRPREARIDAAVPGASPGGLYDWRTDTFGRTGR